MSRALLIDDDLAWLEESRRIMEGLGAEVVINIGPIGALAAARIFCPDVVFLDLGMPQLDGSWLFAELKKTVPRIFFCFDQKPGIFYRFARAVGASGTISKTEVRAGSSELRAIIEGKKI
jgi:CheY-like chemotaxis protein